ncbi:hypothetical protein GAYE_SCF53G6135 [Galdieria yellowstonensis]|uniref:Uncharacterized protein n=1 Tax=Galdieria yellowstonensis TaxID=3028027 RepID=A0AAV9ILC5_9RHOD|nr:hypothetical protein GAYE_SCF53G6135 [Galdieria yellowstonensis]
MQSTSRASFTTRGDIRRQVEGFATSGDRNRDALVDLSAFFTERGYSTNHEPSKYWEEKLVTIGSVVVPKWVPIKGEPPSKGKQEETDQVFIGYEAIYYPEKPPERQPIALEENKKEEEEQEKLDS